MSKFEEIRKEGRLLFEYIRGSHLYGLNTPQSDIDTGGVYCCTSRELFCIDSYIGQVSDERHDNTWFEIGKLTQLLIKSNPTILETLFIPEDKIIGDVSPLFMLLKENREKFVSKECFVPFFGYAKSQIEKARGLNKKITCPIVERKTPLDFTYTFCKQGSIPILQWLSTRGLKTEYCGLNSIPHMHDMYGLYYDWGNHLKNEKFYDENFERTLKEHNIDRGIKPYNYRGLVCEDISHTTQLRLSSIDNKDELPLCFICFNSSGFQTHCRLYKEYNEWVENRNATRYESNLDKSYDSKNMMNCFRMIHMAEEIAEGRGVILERTEDKRFLMDIRNHKFEYEEIMEMLEGEKEKMNKLIEKSTIREKVDVHLLNEILFEIRNRQFKLAF